MVGWKVVDALSGTVYRDTQTGTMEDMVNEVYNHYPVPDMVVAHNAKFDLKWLIRHLNEGGVEAPWSDMAVHCTMTAEYLNSGQADKFITLEDLAKKLGFKMEKTMDLGEYIDGGGKMEDIPKDELDEYLRQDVEIVAEIFLKQWRLGKYRMNYIWPLSEMEMNGLPVDRIKCETLANTAADYCDEFVKQVKRDIMDSCEWRDGDPITSADFEKKIKPTANRTLSFLLAGEPAKVRTTSDKWTFGFKDGYKPILDPATVSKIWGKTKPTNLGYPMEERYTEKVAAHLVDGWGAAIPTWRSFDKLLNTYYLPFLSKSEETGCLHPKLNTTATATGRLSSSDPNGQNMPEAARRLIKALDGHKIVELDFSQLELVALAYICGDPQMLKDINNGEDIHYNSGESVMGWTDPSEMTKDDRKLVKNVNFGAVYGGKAPGLAYQTGVKKDTIQKLINSLYTRYPSIGEWQKDFYKEVVENMEPNGHDDKGEQLYKSTVESAGRTYTFFETPSPKWLRAKMGRSYSFNPNQVYNYPIQGFAGWQIVLQFLYRLWIGSETSWKYMMTVHDSVVVQVPVSELKQFEQHLKEQTRLFTDELKLPVPLEVDMEVGTTWS